MRVKNEHKWHGRRILAALLTLVMLLSVLPVSVFAAGSEGQIGKHVELESYADGLKDANDANVADVGKTVTLERGKVVMMKDIRSTETKNEFIIDLTVKTSEEIEKQNLSADAAVTLVIDVSSSMQWDMDQEGYCWNEECKDYKEFFSSDDAKSHKCSDYPSRTPDSKKNGGDQVYAGNPNETADKWDNSRLEGAINAANSFLSKYVENANGAKRMVSVIAFNAGKETVCGWTDAATTAGYSAVASAIDGLTEKTGTGTSIGGGLNQVSFTGDAASISNKYVILLTDGDPNRKANGDKGTDWNEITTIANNIKRSADLYVISYSDSVTQTSNLQSIASSGCYYSAGNAGSLSIQFGTIVKEIVKRANAWRVTDPMGDHIDFQSFTGGYSFNQNDGSFSESGNTIYWNLKNAKHETEGKIRKYTLSYKIELLTSDSGFEDNKYYPTNEETTLVYALSENGTNVKVDTGYFYVPTVQGESPKSTTPSDAPTATLKLTKEWDDEIPGSTDTVTVTLTNKNDSTDTASATTAKTGGADEVLEFTGLIPGATYEVSESPDKYIVTPGEIRLSEVTVTGFTFQMDGKDTPCNVLDKPFNLEGRNCLIIKKGNDILVWTLNTLSAEERAQFRKSSTEIKDNNSCEFFDSEGELSKVAVYTNGGATVTVDPGKGTVTFSGKSVWSLMYKGFYSYVYDGTQNDVTITNSLRKGNLTIKGKTFVDQNGADITSKIPAGKMPVKFLVKNSSGAVVGNTNGYTLTQIQSGVTIENLLYGDYTIEEHFAADVDGSFSQTTAPKGNYSAPVFAVSAADATVTAVSGTTVTLDGDESVTLSNTYTFTPATSVTVEYAWDTSSPYLTWANVTELNGVADPLATNNSVTMNVSELAAYVANKGLDGGLRTVPAVSDYAMLPLGYSITGWFADTNGDGVLEDVGDAAAAVSALQGGDSIRLYARLADNMPTYKIKYEYYYKENAATTYSLVMDATETTKAYQDPVTEWKTVSARTAPSASSLFADIKAGSVSGVSASVTKPGTNPPATTYTMAENWQTGEVRSEGDLAAGTLVYTVKVYGQKWTQGYLTITKTITGLDNNAAVKAALENALSFTVFKQVEQNGVTDWETVTGLESIPYSEFTEGAYDCGLLDPGVYKVVENNGDLSNEGYTWNHDGETEVSVEKIISANGVTQTAAFTNAYSGKMYRIIFEAENGFLKADGVKLDDANKTRGGNIWWLREVGGEEVGSWESSSSLIMNQKDEYKLVYLFGNEDQVTGEAIDVVAKAGYAWKNQYFVLVDEDGDPILNTDNQKITCETFAEAKALLNSYAQAENVTYKLPDPEGEDTSTTVTKAAYTIRLRAVCVYDLTYTFNDFGSEHVTMGYWTVGDAALSSVAKFGTRDNAELVTRQGKEAALTNPDQYKEVIFFVKADAGYQINLQFQVWNSETRETSVPRSEVGNKTLSAMTSKPDFVSQEIWDAAVEAEYTHYFTYEYHGFGDETELHPEYLNRYFKVVATKNPVYAIKGTKTVVQGQGGNQTPGSKEFTFQMSGDKNATARATVTGFSSAEFNFAQIEYTKADTYTYTVKEEIVKSNYWTYDTKEYTVEIVVENDDNGTANDASDDFLKITSVKVDGEEIGLAGDMAEALTFTNTYTKYVAPKEEENGDGDKEIKIPDDPTPLAPLPELPEEPEVEIPEEEIPLAPVPKTGDASALWLALTALSGTGLAGVAVLGRKKREEED